MNWKLMRLKSMSLPEISYRAKQLTRAKFESLGLGLAGDIEPVGVAGRPWCGAIAKDFEVERYVRAADAIIAGRFDVFAMRGVELGFPPQWNRDCRTGKLAPLQFGKTLNYRDERVVGDIKYLWEPNRHLELVTLAQAYHLTGNMTYASAVRTLLESWFEQCPYPLGPNWTSSLEHALRLVNWSFAWHLLGGEVSPLFADAAGQSFKRRWLNSVYQHCHFIAGHFSKFSSANNHLLGEYMGLLIGTTTWPLWTESSRWQQTALRSFEHEALKQNLEDGVNREQAIWYQHEVADMMIICALVGRANGVEFGAEYWARLYAMLEFIVSLMDVSGQVPMIGDADDGLMVRLSQEGEFNIFQSLLATGAVLFERGDFKLKAGRFDDKSRWLLGDDAAARFASLRLPNQLRLRTSFPQGGYYVLGQHFGQPNEIKAVVDCAPLGYLSIAAHGHADALAFTLSVAGEQMLIDPGTYAYHTQKKWRNYFRSTRAHNTVCVDGVDQSVIAGNFMWMKHANATLEKFEINQAYDRLIGQHDGYMRLSDPVLHRREIVFDKASNLMTVTDTLQCVEAHQVQIHWHFHELAKLTMDGARLIVTRDKAQLVLSLEDSGFVLRLARGEETPPLGWVSRSFDHKTPTSVAVWSGEIKGSCVLKTRIQIRLT